MSDTSIETLTLVRRAHVDAGGTANAPAPPVRDVERRAERQDFERARLAADMGKFRTALALLEDCLRSEPDHQKSLGLYGYCLAREGRGLESALHACRHAVAACSYDARLHAQLGYVYFVTGLRRRAAECFEAALRLDPQQEIALEVLPRTRPRRSRFGLRSLRRFLRR